jgi:cell volume regulation protein A
MLMQIMLFIILGILFLPSMIISVLIPGLLFAFFLFFIARPLVMFILMKIFRRTLNEIILVSWAGFRGAASIVFAIHVLAFASTAGSDLPFDADFIFKIVFFVCLLSVIIQGTFLSFIANKLKLTDE